MIGLKITTHLHKIHFKADTLYFIQIYNGKLSRSLKEREGTHAAKVKPHDILLRYEHGKYTGTLQVTNLLE